MGAKTIVLMALPFLVLAGAVGFACWLGKSRGASPRASAWAERLGVGQADEMERQIQYRAVSIAYAVVQALLVGIGFYEVFVRDAPLPLSHLALLAGVLTQSLATLALRHRSTVGDEEYKPYPLWKTLLWIGVVSGAVALFGMLCAIGVLAW